MDKNRNTIKSLNEIVLTSEARGVLYHFIGIITGLEHIDTKTTEESIRKTFIDVVDIFLRDCKWLTLIWYDSSENEIISIMITNNHIRAKYHKTVRVENNPMEFTIIKDVNELMIPF